MGCCHQPIHCRSSGYRGLPCEGLSIEKRLLRMAPDGSWKEVTELNNGDRVKVVLTVKAGRDIDYLAITDQRAACLELLPISCLSRYGVRVYVSIARTSIRKPGFSSTVCAKAHIYSPTRCGSTTQAVTHRESPPHKASMLRN